MTLPPQVRYFIPDTTPPYLDHFDLDLNSNVLSLVFSKTVNASTLKMGGITLQSYVSINNATVSYTLTNGVFMTIDRPVIQIQLTTFDSNQLRSLPILTKSSNTTYISMTSGTIYDMVSLPLVTVNSSSAQKVNNFTSDTSSPSLTQFSINLSQETLTLNFSETVQISSFDATQVTLFYGNISYTLSGGAVLNQTNTPNVTLTLTTTDLNMIKFLYPLATGMNATYIAITMLGVTDVFGNPLIPVPALVASGFVADMVAPRLLSFGLDMNLGTLTITFSETVNTSSLSASGITLQSSANTTIGPFVLSSTSFSPSPNGTVVQVNISAVDLNALKQLTYLALNSSTVFLSLNPGTVLDMSGNPVVAIPASSALPASMYVRDMTRPQLVSFVLDRNVGVLTLTFSETVNATSINVTGLSLQSSSTSNLDSVPLTGGVASNISSYIITITLLSSDLNLIKSHAGLATSVNNTYITSTSLLVSDMFTNPLIPIITANALEAYLVVADRTSPTLKAYDLDMNAGTITFFFSESVNASTFDPTQLTLQNAQTATAYTMNYTLTGFSNQSLVSTVAGTIIAFQISTTDINNIKMMVAMATSQNTTYLSLTSGFIQDQSGNPIVNVSTAAGSQVQKYTPDTSCPSLDAFQLDLNVGLLLLTFNEPVNSRVLNVTGITVQNLKMNPTVKYTLTGGSLNCSQYTVVVVLVLSSYDLNLLKSKTALNAMATSPQNTFVHLTPLAIADSYGNMYCNVTQPLGAVTVLPDQIQPVLLSFNLDMNTGVLTLNFSEVLDLAHVYNLGSITFLSAPINATLISSLFPTASPMMITTANDSINSTQTASNGTSANNQTVSSNSTAANSNQTSLNASSISLSTLLSASGVSYYTLTGGAASINLTSTPNVVTILLTPADLNAIKNTSGLARSPSTAYISTATGLAYDFQGNQVVPVSPLGPLPVSVYVPVYTPPSLLSFTLDMNSNKLTLTFSETVNLSSLLPPAITLQSAPSLVPGQSQTLQGGGTAYFDPLTPTIVHILLTSTNSNAIKLTRILAKTLNSTYMSLTPSLVTNTFGIRVVAINYTSALPGTLVPDTTPPHLVSFSLNMSSEVLALTFDEAVSASSIQPISITLQPTSSSSQLDSVQLHGGNVTLVDSTVIYIQLSKADLNTVKINYNLATSANDTCISFASTAAADLAVPSNRVAAGVTCMVTFTPDLVPPQLVTFAVNVNSSQLILNFDEPIDMATFNVTAITLQSSKVARVGVENVSLTGGQASTINQLQVTVTVTNTDLNLIKQGNLLLRSLMTSFISISASLVEDTSGNAVAVISTASALQASMYVGDGRNPRLLSFDLNMNNGYLTLHFSETVNVSTVNFGGITLQSNSHVDSNSTNLYTLTKGTVLTASNSPDVVLALNNADLNALKTRGIATNNLTTWITLTGAVTDTTALVVLDIVNGVNALPVTLYAPDVNVPMLLSFTIDLNTGTLVLSFNETVNANTLDTTQLTLASGRNVSDSAHTYTLTNTSSTTNQLNLPTLAIALSVFDLNRIKQITVLCMSRNNSYLYLTGLTVADTFGNLNLRVPPSQAIQALLFTPDKTPPMFVGFDLDMNTGTFTLTFSETVNSATLYLYGMTLYNNPSSPTAYYQLRGPYANVSTPFNVIKVVVNNNDLNAIKALAPLLATSNLANPYTSSDTFLDMTSFTIRDMNGNNVTVSPPLPVTLFIPDTTPPQLLSFSIDMNKGQLTLNFSETVQSGTLILGDLSLLSNATFVPIPYNPADQQQLTGGTVLTSANSFSVTFQLSNEDSNTIKAKNMCTRALGVLNCYMAYGTGAVEDMSNNSIIGCRYLH